MEPEMDNAYHVLHNIFGHTTFRLSQEAVGDSDFWRDIKLMTRDCKVIRRLLVEKENALVVFPTGGTCLLTCQIIISQRKKGGKSLTYQIPAICLDVCLIFPNASQS